MRGCDKAMVMAVTLAVAGALLMAWPSAAPAANTAEGFCQSWLLLGQYDQGGGSAPGVTAMRLDYLTDGAGVTEGNIIPTDGMVVNTDFAVAASTAFNPGTRPEVVPTVFSYTPPAEVVDFNTIFGDEDDVMMYAFTYVTNSTGGPLPTYVGVASDDSILVMINGIEVGANSQGRGVGAGNEVQNSWPVTLQPGVNLVTVKVFEGGGGFGCRFRLQNADVTGVVDATTAQSNVTYDINPAGYTYPVRPVLSASRDLPTSFTAGTPAPVTITILWQADSALTVEETLPTGWTASSISDGGSQTGDVISWSLPSFTADKQLTYSFTAPSGSSLGQFDGFVLDSLAVNTVIGDEFAVTAQGYTGFQNGQLPTSSYDGGTDAHILMWGPTDPERGLTNNGLSYFLEEGDWSGTGATAENIDSKIPLLRFDLNDIPTNATVEQAVLRIYHFQSRQPCQGDQTIYASKLLKSWAEGTGGNQDGRVALPGEVNWWWARQDNVLWEIPGARGVTDMAAPESSAIVSEATLDTWIEWDVTQMAGDWVANPVDNFGLKLAQDPDVATSSTMWVRGLPGFYSGDYADNLALRPILLVQWTAAEPSLPVKRWELYE